MDFVLGKGAGDLYIMAVQAEIAMIKAFEKRIPHFKYIPTLSRPEPDLQWQGETGLITAPLEHHLKDLDIQGAQAYLCGSPGMIKACTQLLNKYGIKNSSIYFDPFA